MMNNRQKILSSAVIMACSTMSGQAQAALAANATLEFDAGAKACVLGGTPPSSCDYGVTSTTGSYFSMDSDGSGSVSDNERTVISINAGLKLGTIQPATGTHSGAVDGTESPGLDAAWEFFGNTGLHQTTSAVTILTDNGAGTVTLDFSGWNVTWNGIASIPMGGDTANFGSDNNIANVTCYTDSTKATTADCADGTFFVLNHENVHVPLGDASGFGGVAYTVYLEGTINVPPALTANGGTLDLAYAASFDTNDGVQDGRISMSDLTTTGIADDSDFSFSGGLFNFEVNTLAGAGASAEIMIPLTSTIPADAVYRKYVGGVWSTFTAVSGNLIASAAPTTAGDSSTCPIVTDAVYDNAANAGLIEGYQCLHLTLVDGSVYDYDGLSDSTVTDPGGIATALVEQVDTRTSSTSGCSMSETPVNPGQRADWWLVAGFMAALAGLRFYRQRRSA